MYRAATTRRDFLKVAGLGAAAMAVPRTARGVQKPAARPTGRPNIIVILADDQRADYLGCAGHPIIRTPNIDALAKRGTYFVNAFVTTAACTPSRTSIMTGQYERKHGITFGSNSALKLEAFGRTYPMVLKQAGYFTGYVGKNHTPVGSRGGKVGYGSGVMEQQFDYWYGNHGHSSFYPKKRYKIYRNAADDTQVEIFQEGAVNFLDPNEKFLAGAKQFLKARPKNKPFCLMVNFNVPHSAGTLSMRMLPTDDALYRTAYRDRIKDFQMHPTYIRHAGIKTPKIPRRVYNGEYISSYNYVKTPASMREQMVRVCQTVSGIDRLTGRLVAELNRQGIADNTIIVYFSDHGIQFGEHGLGGKVLLYEQSIRVPMIICDPRMPAARRGTKVAQFALSIDIAPTLLDLAGIDVPDGMQGRSLRRLMLGEDAPWREDFFCENMFMGQNYPRIECVRGRRWKYIRYFDKKLDRPHAVSLTASIRGERPIYEELYDLAADPHETRNLAGDPKHRDALEKMRRRNAELVVLAKGGPEPPPTIPTRSKAQAGKKPTGKGPRRKGR